MYFMYVILLVVGILIGIRIRSVMSRNEKVVGVVQIDHETGLCRFSVTKEQLSDLKCNKVVFTVEHNAVITDDDYIENSWEKQRL